MPEHQESPDERRAEFDRHVWDHTQDEFQLSFEDADELTAQHIVALRQILRILCDGGDDAVLANRLSGLLRDDRTLIYRLLQLTGGTRSRLKTDLEAKAAALRLKLKFGGQLERFVDRAEHWALAQPYLIARIRETFHDLCLECEGDVERALRTLNTATWPGYVRGRRAKLSGHEAERRLAIALAGLGIAFAPESKATTRGAPDVQYNGQSFDLAVPNAETPLMLVISGAQTGNIGQFGESKAQDTKNAAEMLDASFANRDRRPVLLAFVDGVGYWGNAAGLRMILESADEFAQFLTLWKALAIAATLAGIDVTIALPAEEIAQHRAFLDRYGVEAVEATDEYLAAHANEPKVEAGEAIVFLNP